eukprot:6178344-Pleurochrysis_carterae.AAC.1
MAIDNDCQWSGSGAGAGAGRTYGRGGSGQGCSAGCGGHARTSIQSLGSRTRALRNYACDANANRKTVHVSDKMGRATRTARIVRRARAKRVNIQS